MKYPLYDAELLALGFAFKAHGDQRYGHAPYVTHLAAVRDVLIEFGCVETTHLIAAWLHDTIEDTSVTREQIDADFGHDVARYVWAVTGVGANRAERNHSAYDKMRECPESIVVKLADRIANTRAAKATNPHIFKMYQHEYLTFRGTLRPVTKFADIVCSEPMWKELDRLYSVTPSTPPGAS
jgi:guanosine-3',5'-bis(diphosphate) 3'-pyrophosphohydrolase